MVRSRSSSAVPSKRSRAKSSPLRAVSLSDVAKKAGVTTTAVSALFKGNYYGHRGSAGSRRSTVGISAETQLRILTAARALDYQPAEAAWRLRLYPEKGDLCFLLPQHVTDGIANPYFGRFVNGAMTRLHAEGRHLAFAFFDPAVNYREEPDKLPVPIRSFQCAGCLLAGNLNQSLLTTLTERRLPVVVLSRLADLPGVSGLAPDYARAVRLQFTYLRAQGHRRIAVACGSYQKNIDYAWGVLSPAIQEANREVFPDSPAELVADEVIDGQGGFPLWRRLRALRPQPTAVAFLDDYAARMTMLAALRDGVRVPGNLSFIGMNNDTASIYAPVPLSTIDFHGDQLGAEAVGLIAERARWGAPADMPAVRRITPVTLLERGSVAKR